MCINNDFINQDIKLSKEYVHIFLLNMDDYDDQKYYEYLSHDEKERANRLKIEIKRKQFIVSRSVLKLLMASCLSKNHDEIIIYYGKHDKPFIKDRINNEAIEFNISHSENRILIALTLDNSVGVDIEKVNKKVDHESLSKRFFSQQEYEYLNNPKLNNKIDAFYNIWSRKEAFIKAIGEGIAFGLDTFSVSSNTELTNEINFDSKKTNEKWSCFELMHVDEYKTALSTNNKSVELIFYQ